MSKKPARHHRNKYEAHSHAPNLRVWGDSLPEKIMRAESEALAKRGAATPMTGAEEDAAFRRIVLRAQGKLPSPGGTR